MDKFFAIHTKEAKEIWHQGLGFMSIRYGVYCLQFEIYTGKAEGGNVEHGSYCVVMNLMKLYLDKGYHLYMDNFYTNLALFRALLDKKTYARRTIRVNRGEFPQWFKHKN